MCPLDRLNKLYRLRIVRTLGWIQFRRSAETQPAFFCNSMTPNRCVSIDDCTFHMRCSDLYFNAGVNRQRIIELVSLASATAQSLSTLDATNAIQVKSQAETFIRGCEDLKSQLMEHLKYVAAADVGTPYRNAVSTYSSRKDLDIAAQKTSVVIAQLEAMIQSPSNGGD